jgi:hypothetical protein
MEDEYLDHEGDPQSGQQNALSAADQRIPDLSNLRNLDIDALPETFP